MDFAQFAAQQLQSDADVKSSSVRDLLSSEVILVGGGEAAGCLN